MGFMGTILGSGGGGIGDLVQKIVGTFKLSPEAKLEFDKAMAENAAKLKELDSQLQITELNAASANIQAEAKSGDKFTSRARPMFLYVMEFIIAWNYIIVPIFRQTPVPLPDPLFWLFGSAVLGYVGARSWEKISGVAK